MAAAISKSDEGLRREVLRQMTLFSHLAAKDLEALAWHTRLVRFDGGQVLMEEGAAAHVAYVLLQGRVRVIREGVPIVVREEGTFIGELALLDSGERSATVAALEPVVALELERDGFRKMLRRHSFVEGLLASLAAKLRQTVTQQVEDTRARFVLREALKQQLSQFVAEDILDRTAIEGLDDENGASEAE